MRVTLICTFTNRSEADCFIDIIDDGGVVDIVNLDFAKAFDTVPHHRLMLKLQSYGIGSRVLKWIGDFLSNRRQRVVMEGVESAWTLVVSGIPQGSVMGPILFVCFINDLPTNVLSTIYMYADDTKLFRGIKDNTDTRKLQQDLDTCLLY